MIRARISLGNWRRGIVRDWNSGERVSLEMLSQHADESSDVQAQTNWRVPE